MRIHYFQHVPFEGLGSIESWMSERGFHVRSTELFRNLSLPDVNDVDFLIIMGGPMSVHDEDEYPWLGEEKRFIKEAVERGKAVLGICLGAQLIAAAMGARVYRNPEKEIGWFPIERRESAVESKIARLFPRVIEAFHWHGETFDVPEGCVHIARSVACENQAFAYEDRVLGLQFHLETTPDGARDLIENCGHELMEGNFIRSAEIMLGDSKRFERANRLMCEIVQFLTGRVMERVSG